MGMFEKYAKERQGARTDIMAKMPEGLGHTSREQAAKTLGVGERYVQEAKRIKEEDPEAFQKIKSGTK